MHPAYSVIVFTTASGAGYGLLFLLGLMHLAGYEPDARWFLPATLTVALALIAIGLISSTFHLGRPERAWRAFSQWRSSWLSREGVAAAATFVPAGLFWLLSLVGSEASGAMSALGILSALMSAVTVYCTAMIYASLATIRQWHDPWVAPAYLSMAVASGAVLLFCATVLFDGDRLAPGLGAAAALLAALAIKLCYWRSIDTADKTHSMAAATGLESPRQIAPPHTGPNYVMMEMGYRVARRHARRLRTIAVGFGFVLPALASIAAGFSGQSMAIAGGLLAVLSCGLGLVIERWLFFAEAQHVVTLYYGEAAA